MSGPGSMRQVVDDQDGADDGGVGDGGADGDLLDDVGCGFDLVTLTQESPPGFDSVAAGHLQADTLDGVRSQAAGIWKGLTHCRFECDADEVELTPRRRRLDRSGRAGC